MLRRQPAQRRAGRLIIPAVQKMRPRPDGIAGIAAAGMTRCQRKIPAAAPVKAVRPCAVTDQRAPVVRYMQGATAYRTGQADDQRLIQFCRKIGHKRHLLTRIEWNMTRIIHHFAKKSNSFFRTRRIPSPARLSARVQALRPNRAYSHVRHARCSFQTRTWSPSPAWIRRRRSPDVPPVSA